MSGSAPEGGANIAYGLIRLRAGTASPQGIHRATHESRRAPRSSNAHWRRFKDPAVAVDLCIEWRGMRAPKGDLRRGREGVLPIFTPQGACSERDCCAPPIAIEHVTQLRRQRAIQDDKTLGDVAAGCVQAFNQERAAYPVRRPHRISVRRVDGARAQMPVPRSRSPAVCTACAPGPT
jgi:hypothetical protein